MTKYSYLVSGVTNCGLEFKGKCIVKDIADIIPMYREQGCNISSIYGKEQVKSDSKVCIVETSVSKDERGIVTVACNNYLDLNDILARTTSSYSVKLLIGREEYNVDCIQRGARKLSIHYTCSDMVCTVEELYRQLSIRINSALKEGFSSCLNESVVAFSEDKLETIQKCMLKDNILYLSD